MAKPFEGRGEPSGLEPMGARGSASLAPRCCRRSQMGRALVAPAWAASVPLAGGAGAGTAVATLQPVGAAGR